MARKVSLSRTVLLALCLWCSSCFCSHSHAEGLKRDRPGVSDFRAVSYEDLSGGLEVFADEQNAHFTEMLFDLSRYQVIVGARDALYRLSLEGLTKLEKAPWEARQQTIGLCTAKGQTEDDCRNYVKVLVAQDGQLLACGTNAYSPKCSWREIEEINRVNKWIDGKAKCPHSPRANVSALMTKDGDYYVAGPIDFSSNDHAIYRMSGSTFEQTIRTAQYNALWLSQPDFVGSFETDRFVYFVFREAAVEHVNCGKAVYSRIARVCKQDRGGTLVMKNSWTTFLKARLNCSVPGDHPFYFDEVQSMQYVESEATVYAVFTTGENALSGSAVCSFRLSAVEEAFSGPFKAQSRADSWWEPVAADHAHFQCDAPNHVVTGSISSREYQLVNTAVQPVTKEPIFRESDERYTHVAVEAVPTKHQDPSPVHVIFVATRSGLIKKLSFNPRTGLACLVEILQPFPSGRTPTVHSLRLLEATSSLYLATTESVVRVATQRCARFASQTQCLGAMDPYCGWNRQREECTMTPNKNPRAAYWLQDPIACPRIDMPINGGWSTWSEWFRCSYEGPDGRRVSPSDVIDGADTCLCKRRSCDRPTPANDGAVCSGSDLEVTNCTQHGQWTPWSEWSACSKTCDVGMQQRKRTCGNPAPAFGGRVCVGRDVDTQFCADLPSCSDAAAAVSSVAPAASARQTSGVLANRWTSWSEWSKCSVECGVGFRSRTRKCYGAECAGCDTDFEQCENRHCSELMEVTDWTPWVRLGGNSSVDTPGSWHEKRFKFTYRSPVSVNAAGRVEDEERFCTREHCSTTSIARSRNGGGQDTAGASTADYWSDWSKCTRECGTGYQLRVRTCPGGEDCRAGSVSVSERACNTHPCPGQWSCWSEWSNCDRAGKRRRARECASVDLVSAGGKTGVTCAGGSSYEELPCDGWGPWGAWTECDRVTGHATRFRTCEAAALGQQCAGADRESRRCDGADVGVEAQSGEAGVASVVVACVSGFVLGAALGAALVYYFLVFRRGRGAQGSPHYVSAKSQNLYVSLPMLDLHRHSNGHLNGHHKTLTSSSVLAPSECGTLRSTTTAGTLRSKASSYGKGLGNAASTTAVGASHIPDYETATIKRTHSHRNSSLLAGNMRADLDSDQIFT